MEITPGQRQLLAYWGNIQAAVSQRASTAELWDAVRQASAAEGVQLIGVSATDMSSLRAIASAQRNAMEQLAALRPDGAITGTMIASDLSARPLADQALAPSWIVRFEHDVTINGELQTLWRSSVFEGSLPPTAGALRSAVEGDAGALAEDYGVTHVGVGRIQISAV